MTKSEILTTPEPVETGAGPVRGQSASGLLGGAKGPAPSRPAPELPELSVEDHLAELVERQGRLVSKLIHGREEFLVVVAETTRHMREIGGPGLATAAAVLEAAAERWGKV